ncbi:MAG: MBL fold metallo-hydrolase [Candidatus Nanopelagicales bacterium]
MNYDGKVEVGGPWQVQETSQVEIRKLAVGFFDNNCYLLRDKATGQALLIDAAAEADRILAMCDGRLDAILTTHCHPDHVQALQEVVDQTGARTYASGPDAPLIPVVTDELLSDGSVLPLGAVSVEVVELVGHKRLGSPHISTSLGAVYRDADGSTHAFTGDALFPGGVGNTCDDAAAYSTLLNDVASKLFAKLPDRSVVYPGHGWDTTIGTERPSLQSWANRHW